MALDPFVLWGIKDDFGTSIKTVAVKLLWMLAASGRLCVGSGPCPGSLRWERMCVCVSNVCLSFHTLEE